MSSSREADFKKLAETTVANDQEIAAEQKRIRLTLDEMCDRLMAFEKLLREFG